MICPKCSSEDIRTFSHFDEKLDSWTWMNGCNECTWEIRNRDEEKLHPEFYTRMATSPAKISSSNIQV